MDKAKPLMPFWKRLAAFGWPYAVILPVLLAPVLVSGEAAPVGAVVAAQSLNRRILYGPAYINTNISFKRRATLSRRAEVLALGTSRTMQLRGLFLTRSPGSFYNAGGAVRTLPEMRVFVEGLPPDARPRVLIVGLDQYFFNKAWDSLKPRRRPQGDEETSSVRALRSFREALSDYRAGKFDLRDVLSPSDRYSGSYIAIGLRARSKSGGFRADGSLFDGRHAAAPEAGPDHEFKSTLRRVRAGNSRFEPGAEPNPAAIGELDRLLSFCRTNGIHVIGFLPPYAHAVVEAMEESGRHGYIRKLPGLVQASFERHGFRCLDATDLASLGAGDEETVGFDAGFHGSEVAYLRLFIRLAEIDQTLLAYADTARLAEMLGRRVSPWYIEDRIAPADGRSQTVRTGPAAEHGNW
jgi:hypothetical protein